MLPPFSWPNGLWHLLGCTALGHLAGSRREREANNRGPMWPWGQTGHSNHPMNRGKAVLGPGPGRRRQTWGSRKGLSDTVVRGVLDRDLIDK
jgi:hypothetical protein